MVRRGRAHVGTSGWNYPHWRGPFYPEDLPDRGLLSFYAERLGTVEVNRTFYSLPGEDAVRAWGGEVPDDFVFAVKASRYVTHLKKLKDPRQGVGRLLERISALGHRLGPILFQLPPRWGRDPERLAGLLEVLPDDHRYAFEFRDTSWFHEEIYGLLRDRGCAFCIWDLAGTLAPREVTADFVYVRLHGPGDAYEGSYDRQTLAGWAGALSTWRRQGRDVYCYFDNDQDGHAARNAMALGEMVAD